MLNQIIMEKNQFSKSIIKRIYSHLDKKRKRDLYIVLFLSIFSSLAESISIAILIPFVSIFLNPDTYLINDSLNFFLNIFNINNSDDLLGTVSFLFVVIVILSAFIKIKFVNLSNRFAENINSDFRIKIFEFFFKQKFSYFVTHGSTEIMTTLLSKTKYTSTITSTSINIFNSIFVSSAILGVLVYFDPLNTSVLIFSTILFFYVTFKIRSITVFNMGTELNLKSRFFIDIFTNAVGYLPEVIIYNLRNIYFKVFKKNSNRISELRADMTSIAMYAKYYFESFIIVFVIAIIYFGNFTDKSIEANISYFAILAFAAQKCLPLINGIYKASITFRGAVPMALNTVNILDDTKFNLKSLDDTIENKQPIPFKKKIKIEKIKYQYSKDLPFVLKNVSFEINKGDKIITKGKTGTGKSTLINIILGLLNPTEGKLIVDDIEVNEGNQINWQKNIAIVPQSVFVDNATILENIAIAEDPKKINLEKIKQSTKIAQIDSFIESLPNKYNEMIGERGAKISGGQRQRLGIARALYRNANLIVLDEPTNALDLETEKKVIESITSLEATIIMISHSDIFLKYFNKVIDLNDFK